MPSPTAEGDPSGLVSNYDCQSGKNCYLKRHLYDFSSLNELAPGYNRFTDIDGVLDVAGKILFLEFKSENYQLKGVQLWLHRHLTEKEGQSTLIVWRGRDGQPVKCQWITQGEEGDKIELPNGEEDLKRIIQTWIAI